MVKETSIQAMQWGKMEIAGPRHSYREALLYNVFHRKLKKGKVLDAGCGSGSMLIKLLKDGYSADGLEASKEFVKLVNKKILDSDFNGRAEVKVGTIIEVPCSDDYFDGLIASEVLEHVEDDKRAVKEFCRVLKDGGICIASVPAHPHLWDESDEWAGHKRRYTRESMTKLFERNGFKVEEVFFWGFPLVRLYNKIIFSRWVKRNEAGKSSEMTDLSKKTKLFSVLSEILATVFRFDSLFNSLPWGIGIILCARKI